MPKNNWFQLHKCKNVFVSFGLFDSKESPELWEIVMGIFQCFSDILLTKWWIIFLILRLQLTIIFITSSFSDSIRLACKWSENCEKHLSGFSKSKLMSSDVFSYPHSREVDTRERLAFFSDLFSFDYSTNNFSPTSDESIIKIIDSCSPASKQSRTHRN